MLLNLDCWAPPEILIGDQIQSNNTNIGVARDGSQLILCVISNNGVRTPGIEATPRNELFEELGVGWVRPVIV